jgi:rsbT co-antagonist protein RsbR
MSEAITVEILTQLLSRAPGASWSFRVDLSTRESAWIYVDARAADLYDVPEAELRVTPKSSTQHVVPEDRAWVDAAVVQSFQTLAPVVWVGQLVRRSGDRRWIEVHIAFERESSSSIIVYGQGFDITERKRLEQALHDSEEALRKAEIIHRAVVEALPVGVILANRAKELLIFNPAQQRMSGGTQRHDDGDVTGAYGVFMADGKTPLSMENSGISRALRGEELEQEVVISNPRIEAPVLQHILWKPMRDDSGDVYAALGVAQDITLQRQLETELRRRNAELAESEAEKTALIERLRLSIDELSYPILEVWDDVLVMPIIGLLDSQRAADMAQRLLAEVARRQASYVILDLTGLTLIDNQITDHLFRLIRKVEVLGARCVLTGIRSHVAETLIGNGVGFERIKTLRNLKHGLREAMGSARGGRDTAKPDLAADRWQPDDDAPRRRPR